MLIAPKFTWCHDNQDGGMMRKSLIFCALMMFALSAGAWPIVPSRARTPSLGQSVDLMKGEQLCRDHSAPCHGANLEGPPDWRSAGTGRRFAPAAA
jgi:hypothetical protein